MDAKKADLLRLHLREKLLDYALTHLVVDYVLYTQNAVVDILSESLEKVPTTEEHSVTLPVDPFDVLTQSYGLDRLQEYDEMWTADEQVVNCVRREVVATSGKPKTETCWSEEASRELDEHYAQLRRPESPILTNRAKKKTPALCSNRHLQDFPQTVSDVLQLKSIQKVKDQVIESPPRLKLDDVLDVKTILDVETHAKMITLLKLVAFPADSEYENAHVEAFLHDLDLPAVFLPPEPMFAPIFTRPRILGAAASSSANITPLKGLTTFPNLASVLPSAEMSDDMVDRHKDHMAIVDGWQTLVSSPDSFATPPSSQFDHENQIDAFFLQSSPNTEVTPVQALENAKMEHVEIPRNRKLGSTVGNNSHGQGQGFSTFILPLISGSRDQRPEVAPPIRLSPPLSDSMIGQATSVNHARTELTSDGILDTYVSRCVEGSCPEDIILSERLLEKDVQLLDVPNLPPPNVHPGIGIVLPESLSALVVVPRDKILVMHPDSANAQQGFLHKVKGTHSLAMALSWIPFKSSMKGVTHDQAANVLEFSGNSLGECDADQTQVKTLLQQQLPDDDDAGGCPERSEDLWFNAAVSDYCPAIREFAYAVDGSDMTLTREERLRFSGTLDSHGGKEGRYAEPAVELDDYRGLPIRADEHTAPTMEKFSGLSNSSETLHHDSRRIPNTDRQRNYHSPGVDIGHTSQERWESSGECESWPTRQAKEQFTSAPVGIEATALLPLSTPLDSQFDIVSSGWPCPKPGAPYGTIPDLVSNFSIPTRFHREPDAACPTGSVSLGDNVDSSSSATHHRSGRAEPTSSVLEFARLRARDIPEPQLVSLPSSEPHTPARLEPEPDVPPSVPQELVDSKTVSLHWPQPNRTTVHHYLASMDVIQKQGLVRSLRAERCLVNLIERDTLGGVDLIVDPHTAIIFMSLQDLRHHCDSLVNSISLHSWRYSYLLVVFEVYPENQSYRPSKGKSSALQLNFYTPPNTKAVKKLRRGLSIAEGIGTKASSCCVYMAFANTVDEAACLARAFGEFAETNDDTQGLLWGTREWLDWSPHEYEQDLAAVDGMNPFAALVILSSKPLQDFLDSAPNARLAEFGPLVGFHRMEILNGVLDERHRMMDAATSSQTMEDLEGAVARADDMLVGTSSDV